MRRLLIPGVMAVALATLAAGCGNVQTETSATTSYTETFTGIVNPGGGALHTFTVTQAGSITASLTTIGDDNTRILGLALGNWSGNACQIAVADDTAPQNLVLTAKVSAAGTLCARVYDSQAVPDATSYVLSVTHP